MKQVIFILACLFTFTVLGQKYELFHNESDTIYPFEYWLTLDFSDEPNKITLTNSSDQKNHFTIKGKVIDYRNSPIQVMISSLNPNDSSVLEHTFSDSNGDFSLNFNSKQILLKFSYGNQLKTYFLTVNQNEYAFLTYTIQLGRKQPFEHYIIYSKRELSTDEINITLNCIQRNFFFDRNKSWGCDNGNDFYIGMSGG